MIALKEALKTSPVLVSDGAWGTFLYEKGLSPGECPELWNVDHPDKVLEIARSYVDAGADIILTNSFGGSKYKLMSYHLEKRVFELNKAAAEISRKAAGKNVYVLGSVGPTGVILMMGEHSPQDLYNTFKEQAMALSEGGADGILMETMSDLEEAVLAVRAAKENTTREVLCTMTFTKTPQNEFRTMMGVSPEQAVEELIAAGADIIGANCGNGTAGMIEIVKVIRKINKDVPVLIHANAGLPHFHDGKTIYPESPEVMAEQIKDLIEAGANIIGGCCGTTPEHIRRIVSIVKKF